MLNYSCILLIVSAPAKGVGQQESGRSGSVSIREVFMRKRESIYYG